MPFYTIYLLLDEDWPLGKITCELWLALDYTVCLASQYTGELSTSNSVMAPAFHQ